MRYLIQQKISLQLLSLYLLFVIPVLLGGAGLYVFQQNVLTQNAFQSDLGLAQAVALEVGANLQAATEVDSELSTAQAAKDMNVKQLTSMFANSSHAHPDINLYVMCDPSGNIRMSYPFSSDTIGQKFGPTEYFQRALKSDSPLISSGSISTITDSYVVSIASRITDDRGKTVGVMILNLSLDILTSHLNTVHQRLSPSNEVGLWVIDHQGQTIATTRGIFAFLNLPEDYEGLIHAAHNALQGEAGNFITHSRTRDWLYSYIPIPEEGWAIVVQRPTDTTFAALTNFQNGLIAALVLLVMGASFFWFMMHRRIISPLTRLAKVVTMIQPDQPSGVIHMDLLNKDRNRRDEIGNLIAAFSAMEREMRSHLRKNDETIEAQFRTLDAIMRSMDEGVLLESPDGQIVYANHIFSREVGIPQQELMSSRVQDHHLQERFSAMFAHPENYDEVVEPLTAIKGFATSLLEEAAGEVDTGWQEYSLRQVVAESNRMADLVTNLLEMAQVEAGTLKLSPGAYHLSSLLEDTLVVLPNARSHVQVCLPEEVPLLYVDGRRIQIVLRNILENAQRYGGPDVFIEISATYEREKTKKRAGLTLHILDNGPGIPSQFVERVFDSFYQVESGHERSSSGVGLGLAICRGFIEAHGGRIWAENRTDGKHGAVFHLWFPPIVLRTQERQQQYL